MRSGAAAALAAALVSATYLLPWARSGRASRSGFALARTLEALGLAEGVARRALLLAVWLSPALAGLAWITAALGRARAAGAVAAAVGAAAVAGALLVVRSGTVDDAAGAWAGLAAGALAVAAGLAALARSRHG